MRVFDTHVQAKRIPLHFLYPQLDNQLLYNPCPTAPSFSETNEHELQLFASSLQQSPNLHGQESSWDDSCTSISAYLEEDQLQDGLGNRDPSDATESYAAQDEFKGQKLEQECLKVPDSLIDRWGDAFDVVTPNSKRCCCFTKSYGRFVKGTGSFLATEQVLSNGRGFKQLRDEGNVDVITKSKSLLKQLRLRYFTPREIANLHSFPKKFKFPDHITQKQRYALLGNSLSVAVVASLLEYLFRNE